MTPPSRDDVAGIVLPLMRITANIRRAGARVIDPTRQALMQAAATHGAVRPTDLARELGVGPSAITRQVRALDDAGHVRVDPDPADRRSCLVSLSEAGWAEARRVTEQGLDAWSEFVADWDAADVAELGRLLVRLEESVAEVRARTPDERPSWRDRPDPTAPGGTP